MRRLAGLMLVGCLLATAVLRGSAADEPSAPAGGRPKVPVAVVWGPGDRVHVALRDAMTVATFDPADWSARGEVPLGFRPADLVSGDGDELLVGGMDGELAALDVASGRVRRLGPGGRGPTRVLALAGGRVAAGSTWDEAVRIVDRRTGEVAARHPLPFAPGAMVVLPDGRLVVADAFGGRLALLEPGRVGSARISAFDGTNLLALGISADGGELLVGHLSQYAPVQVSASNIDWGLVISARLSGVRVADLGGGKPADAPVARRRISLDGSGNGAADPAALAVSADGARVVVALAGANQLLVNDRTLPNDRTGLAAGPSLGDSQLLQTVEVGRNPVALALSPDGELAVTADAMSDTLSVVRLDAMSVERTVTLGPAPPIRDAVARGEATFRDGRRSMDRWMSCATCHVGGHTNGLNFDTQGDGGIGAPKNTPSLLGVGPTAPFTWTGRFDTLSGQVHQSFLTSLRGRPPEPGMADDVAAYLASLAPPPPRRDPADPDAARGALAFEARGCDACHAPPHYTIAATRDVGLDDGPGGNRRFNPPSLRGVARSAPYFHDGRAASLDAALRIHAPGSDGPIPDDERADLVAFLESL